MSAVKAIWLGQSGFIISDGTTEIIVDPYLSDSCLKLKSKLDHTRHTPIVRDPETLYPDVFLVTHPHADHFDPETIGLVLKNCAAARVLCPPSCAGKIDQFFPGERSRFGFLSTSETYRLSENITLMPIPAAHETLEQDLNGEYCYLSFLLNFAAEKTSVFIGGDTVPYPGQAEKIRRHLPADATLTMLLPVNGRDSRRAALGILGNMNLDEAAELCLECGADLLIPCHFGMFAGNDPDSPVTAEACQARGVSALIPEPGKVFTLL